MAKRKLSGISIPERDIPVTGTKQSFSVRALGVADLQLGYDLYAGAIEALYSAFVESDDKLTIPEFVKRVVSESPEVAAFTIAAASDEPGELVIASKLPLLTQIEALTAIAQMTFHSLDALKKTLAQMGLLEKVEGILQALWSNADVELPESSTPS